MDTRVPAVVLVDSIYLICGESLPLFNCPLGCLAEPLPLTVGGIEKVTLMNTWLWRLGP